MRIATSVACDSVRRAHSRTGERLQAIHRVFHERAPMVAVTFLPL